MRNQSHKRARDRLVKPRSISVMVHRKPSDYTDHVFGGLGLWDLIQKEPSKANMIEVAESLIRKTRRIHSRHKLRVGQIRRTRPLIGCGV